jgi:hypothetical protein
LIFKNSKKNCSSRLFFYFLFGYYALVYSHKSFGLLVDTFSKRPPYAHRTNPLKIKKTLQSVTCYDSTVLLVGRRYPQFLWISLCIAGYLVE